MTTSVPYLAPYAPPPVPVEERTRLRALEDAVAAIRGLCAVKERQNRAAGAKLIPALVSVEAVHTILKQHGLPL